MLKRWCLFKSLKQNWNEHKSQQSRKNDNIKPWWATKLSGTKDPWSFKSNYSQKAWPGCQNSANQNHSSKFLKIKVQESAITGIWFFHSNHTRKSLQHTRTYTKHNATIQPWCPGVRYHQKSTSAAARPSQQCDGVAREGGCWRSLLATSRPDGFAPAKNILTQPAKGLDAKTTNCSSKIWIWSSILKCPKTIACQNAGAYIPVKPVALSKVCTNLI